MDFSTDIMARSRMRVAGTLTPRSSTRNDGEKSSPSSDHVEPLFSMLPRDVQSLIGDHLITDGDVLRSLSQTGRFGRDFVRRLPLKMQARTGKQLTTIQKKFTRIAKVDLGLFQPRMFSEFIGRNALRPLAKLPNLQSLDLGRVDRYAPEAIDFIASIASHPRISVMSPREVTDAHLAVIGRLHGITDIGYLRSYRVTDAGLMHLTKLQNLERLDLDHTREIGVGGFAAIAKMRGLKELRIDGMRLESASLLHISRAPQLQFLKLFDCEGLNDESISKLQHTPTLEALDISSTGRMTGSTLSELRTLKKLSFAGPGSVPLNFAGLPALPKLSELELRHSNQVDDQALSHVARIETLRTLDICGCAKVTPDGLQALHEEKGLRKLSLTWYPHLAEATNTTFMGFAKLEELHFRRPALSCEIGKLPILRELSSLKRLTVDRYDSLDDEGMEFCAGLPALLELNISGTNNLRGEGLATLREAPSLRKVDVSYCENLTDVGFAHLAQLPQLHSLEARRCRRLGDAGLRALAQSPTLAVLHLSHCDQVTDAGLALMLTAHSLRDIRVEDAGGITGARLAHFQPDCSVEELNFSSCPNLSDDVLQSIPLLTKLRSLTISGSRVFTGKNIAQLGRLSELRTLNLYSNVAISNANARALTKLPRLSTLDISRCPQVTRSTIRALRRALPSCRIVDDF